MKEALLYDRLNGNRVQCNLCAHHCMIQSGKKGVCKVRINQSGLLYTNVYGRLIANHLDPVEKKPLYHFYPGSQAYSIATPGCNFHCHFCQNHEISQVLQEEHLKYGHTASPADVVQKALHTGCKSIAYTYTEPTVFFEYAYDIARTAHEKGIKNIFVSNGFMTGDMLDVIAPYLDGINVDLKAFRDETYRQMIGGRLQPVLDNLKKIKQQNIWLEVTSLIIPGMNDNPQEIRDMTRFIATELGANVPWHISRFFPTYKMNDRVPTPLATMKNAFETGKKAGIHYVYPGNISSQMETHTLCPQCGHLLIERSHFGIRYNNIRQGRCPECNTAIAGIGM